MRVGVITLIPGMVLVYSACAGDFDPDLNLDDDSDGGTFEVTAASEGHESMSSTGGDDSSPTSDSGTPTSATSAMTSDSGTTSEDSDSSDGIEGESSEGDSSEEDTTPVEPGCGNDQVEGDEECDGEALGGQSCAGILGSGSGQLGCFEDCSYDVSACSLDGGQPEDGLWSECADYPDCESNPPDGIIWFCENNLCSFDCETVADCGPSPGGTAVSECRDLGSDLHRCYLNCEGGKTCPSGMTCTGSYCRSI
jgi:hypothetical protein